MRRRLSLFLFLVACLSLCSLTSATARVVLIRVSAETPEVINDAQTIEAPVPAAPSFEPLTIPDPEDALVIPNAAARSSGSRTLTLTFTGDVTLGSEEAYRGRSTSFESYDALYGDAYFLENFQDLFQTDDLTVINLEGVISDSSAGENKKKEFRFRGAPELLNILKVSSVEACNLSNNHMQDYGDRGYQDTKAALQAADIAYFGYRDSYIFEKDGIRIAFFGLVSPKFTTIFPDAKKEIAAMKADGVNAVVFIFHAGTEYGKTRNYLQERYARSAIDAGADLVIMHHPHVLQGMEIYKNRTICYSLGNFCFGGNSRVKTSDSLMTAVVQADLTFSENGEYEGQQLRIYPAHISGTYPESNFQPVRVTGEEADEVIARIQKDTKYTLNPYDADDGYALQDYLSAE